MMAQEQRRRSIPPPAEAAAAAAPARTAAPGSSPFTLGDYAASERAPHPPAGWQQPPAAQPAARGSGRLSMKVAPLPPPLPSVRVPGPLGRLPPLLGSLALRRGSPQHALHRKTRPLLQQTSPTLLSVCNAGIAHLGLMHQCQSCCAPFKLFDQMTRMRSLLI